MKRIIFALLYSDGSYMLSRNFRLQRIGDMNWLLSNYRLLEVSAGLDELMIVNVSAEASIDQSFLTHVRRITSECFIPVTAGGGVRAIEDAGRLLEVGVDKVLLNEPFHTDLELCESIARRFGSQFLTQGVDVEDIGTVESGEVLVRRRGGVAAWGLSEHLSRGRELGAGEVLIQSVARDGTGRGLELGILDHLPSSRLPTILMGGVGRSAHIIEGLQNDSVDAVATANLLNFVGDAFVRAREDLLRGGVPVAEHPASGPTELRGIAVRRPHV